MCVYEYYSNNHDFLGEIGSLLYDLHTYFSPSSVHPIFLHGAWPRITKLHFWVCMWTLRFEIVTCNAIVSWYCCFIAGTLHLRNLLFYFYFFLENAFQQNPTTKHREHGRSFSIGRRKDWRIKAVVHMVNIFLTSNYVPDIRRTPLIQYHPRTGKYTRKNFRWCHCNGF